VTTSLTRCFSSCSPSLAARALQFPPPSLALPERGCAGRPRAVRGCSHQSTPSPWTGAPGQEPQVTAGRPHRPGSSQQAVPSARFGGLCRPYPLYLSEDSAPRSLPSRRAGPPARCPTGPRRGRGENPTLEAVPTRVPPRRARAGSRPRSGDVAALWTSHTFSVQGGGGGQVPPVSLDSWSMNSSRFERTPSLPIAGCDVRCAGSGPSIGPAVAVATALRRPDRDGSRDLCDCLWLDRGCPPVRVGRCCWAALGAVTPGSSSMSAASGPKKFLHEMGAGNRGDARRIGKFGGEGRQGSVSTVPGSRGCVPG
jgi:hypothetical protein